MPRRRAATIRCAPSSSGANGAVGGSSTSTTTPAPAGVNKRRTRSRSLPSGSRTTPWMSSISTPRPAVAGGEPPDERPDLLRRQLDRGPDVQQDPVPLRAAARLAVGLEAADALERRHEHALELGQRRHSPVGVAHRREVAHLGEREQPLVLRVRRAPRRGTGTRPRPTAAAPARRRRGAPARGGGTSSGAGRGARRPRPARPASGGT